MSPGLCHRVPRLNITSGVSVKMFLDELSIELVDSVKSLPFPVWVGIVQYAENLNRTKQNKKNGGRRNLPLLLLACLLGLGYRSSPAAGLGFAPPASLVLRSLETRIIPLIFLDLQHEESRL